MCYGELEKAKATKYEMDTKKRETQVIFTNLIVTLPPCCDINLQAILPYTAKSPIATFLLYQKVTVHVNRIVPILGI